jgi:hypothetical protein
MLPKSSTSGSWLDASIWLASMELWQRDIRLIQSQVRNEIAVLKRVSMGHRNILTLVDYFETMNNRRLPDLGVIAYV